jgi:hypothetical protein
MATRRTGSRRIVVDGVPYRWRIRKRATVAQVDYGHDLRVAIQLDEGQGSVLVIFTDRWHPHDCSGRGEEVSVRPSDVATWIRASLQTGWAPHLGGPQFWVRARGDAVEKYTVPSFGGI